MESGLRRPGSRVPPRLASQKFRQAVPLEREAVSYCFTAWISASWRVGGRWPPPRRWRAPPGSASHLRCLKGAVEDAEHRPVDRERRPRHHCANHRPTHTQHAHAE
eukprot:3555916-Alexandrium_andersonii.AAC.1